MGATTTTTTRDACPATACGLSHAMHDGHGVDCSERGGYAPAVTPEQRVANAVDAGQITPDDTMPLIERVRELAGRYTHDDELEPFYSVAMALGCSSRESMRLAGKLYARLDACTVGGLRS